MSLDKFPQGSYIYRKYFALRKFVENNAVIHNLNLAFKDSYVGYGTGETSEKNMDIARLRPCFMLPLE